jgi:hypothetical protein
LLEIQRNEICFGVRIPLAIGSYTATVNSRPAPAAKARDIDASEHGDLYSFTTDEYWVVMEMRTDGRVLIGTKRGEANLIDACDLKLRHATLWERIRYRSEFIATQRAMHVSN